MTSAARNVDVPVAAAVKTARHPDVRVLLQRLRESLSNRRVIERRCTLLTMMRPPPRRRRVDDVRRPQKLTLR